MRWYIEIWLDQFSILWPKDQILYIAFVYAQDFSQILASFT